MIAYQWRGHFNSGEVNRLHAEGFEHSLLDEDWWTQLNRHSLGLLRSYLNRGDLLHDLDEQARQLRQALARGEPPAARSVSTVAPGFRQRRLADRLNDTQVQDIISAFEAGTVRWQLAEQYNISVRSVGRLLRQWRAKRYTVA